MPTKLTSDRLKKIMDYIVFYQTKYGYSPTYREIMRATNINSTSLIRFYLDILQERGFIKRSDNITRGIVVLNRVYA